MDKERDLTRKEKVLLYHYGGLELLKKKGMITGPDMLTKKGLLEYAELIDSGFRPTRKESKWAIKEIMG